MTHRGFDDELAALDQAIREARNRVEFDPESATYRSELESLRSRRRQVAEARNSAYAGTQPAARDSR